MIQKDIWNQGVKAMHGVRHLKKSVEELNPLIKSQEPIQDKIVEGDLRGYLKNITVSGAIGAAGLRMAGPLAKRAIDGRATQAHIDMINQGILPENQHTRFVTVTGEGAKDNSEGVPTGKVFSNEANFQNIEKMIHWDTDPVDGTSPTSGFNLTETGQKTFASGGTSIALYAVPTKPTQPAFVALPDTLSIWGFATPASVPPAKLTMQGERIEDMVAENVKRVATAILKARSKKKPTEEELANLIKEEFRVVLMNRDFQNKAILTGLKNAGVDIEFVANEKGQVNFSDWNVDGNSLTNKHFGKGNVSLIGDGNVIFPYMENVHLFIGNSGGPEFLQLIPATQEIMGVFLSKDKRNDESLGTDRLDKLISSVTTASKASKKKKELAFNELFTEKDQKALAEHGFDHTNALAVFDKKKLIGNSKDYATAMTAITPLSGSNALFDIPKMDAVKIEAEKDLVTTSTIYASSSGSQLLLQEEWLMKTKDLKDQIKTQKVTMTEALKQNEVTKKAVEAMLSTYFELAQLYIYFGLYEQSELTLTKVDKFLKRIAQTKPSSDLAPVVVRQSKTYRDYMSIAQELHKYTSQDLKKKENKPKLVALRDRVIFINNPHTSNLRNWMKRDMDNYEYELNTYIKKLS